MKIALVHMRYSWTGGTERYLRHLADQLCERGHDVHIVCRSHKGGAHPGLKFVRLRPFALGGAWRMTSFARAVERHVRAADYDVVVGLGKTWTHDVIRLGGGCHGTYMEQAHSETLAPLEALLGKGGRKHRQALEIEARALAAGSYTRVITNSEMVKRDVCARHGVPAEDVEVIYNGVDTERFHPQRHRTDASALRAQLGIPQGDYCVLFLGTGYGRKGLGKVLRAFPILLAAVPHARLIIVGFDSQLPRYEQLARELGIADRAHFMGGRRDAEVCFAAANVYALPTLYDPFANTTLEALASGLPVLTSDSNGGSELITEGVHGSVLPAQGSPEAWAAELVRWSDPARLASGARAARSLAQAHPAHEVAEHTARLLEGLSATRR